MGIKIASRNNKTESKVIDDLRSARRADDVLTRLRENSLEAAMSKLRKVVESTGWEHGPAEVVSTYTHHAVVRAKSGNLVRVEWKLDEGEVSLSNAKVFDTPTAVHDIGEEVFATAKEAALSIMDDDFDAAGPMLENLRRALNVDGDLDRRLQQEMSLRSINRGAWWHNQVAEEISEVEVPDPVTEGDDLIRRSFDALFDRLREAAGSVSASLKTLGQRGADTVSEQLAQDVAADVRHAVEAMLRTDRTNEHEMVKVYESVGTVAAHLLAGTEYLSRLAEQDEE